MIRISLHLTPSLEDLLKDLPYRSVVDVPVGTSVRDLLKEAGIPTVAIAAILQGRTLISRDDALLEDTHLYLLAPVSGG
jgi:sulfur carrier protein ThiS